MAINRALTLAASASPVELGQAYATAVACGGGARAFKAEDEREVATLRLLALALMQLPHLAVCAYTLDMVADAEVDALATETASVVAADVLRLAHDALEADARDVGYRTDAWLEHALVGARLELGAHAEDDCEYVPVALEQARSSAVALSRAAAATAGDRMQVPEELAGALAHLLAVYVLAQAAGG
jgi:hypothetical protein